MYKRNKANSRPSGLLFGEFLPAGNSGRSVHRDDARMHDPTCAGTKTKDKELLLLSKALFLSLDNNSKEGPGIFEMWEISQTDRAATIGHVRESLDPIPFERRRLEI